MYLQTNGDFEKATLFSFQKGPIFKKMGISTGFYWFFLSFAVHTLHPFICSFRQKRDNNAILRGALIL